jgi:geranylgeranyl diphosphate synthase type I
MYNNECISGMTEVIRDYNLRGGKRIRPAYVIEGYKAVGGTDTDEIYNASLAAEILEGYLLVHDDIMDKDDLRRGGPTVHRIYREYYQKNINENLANATHFGNSMAIIIGDILETMAIDAIANTKFDPTLKAKAIRRYSQVVRYTGYGQALDMLLENMPVEKVKKEDILMVHKLKTSIYTMEGPLHTGGILGGATDEQLKSYTDYAIPLGQAFQIHDDLLGMFGDEKKLGKPATSDLKEGKRTFLIVKALENGTEEQKQKIKQCLGNPNVTIQEVEEIRDIIKTTGSFDYSKNLANELAEQARTAIRNADITTEGKEYMIGIADYMVNREY